MIRFTLTFVLIVVSARAFAQEEAKPVRVPVLPAPLDRVDTNLKDLEKSGHLKIVKTEFRAVGSLGEPAILITLHTIKPLTFRHLQIELDKYRFARFIAAGKKRLEIHNALLIRPDRIDTNAVGETRLQEDEEIQLKLYINPVEIRRVIAGRLSYIRFGRLPL